MAETINGMRQYILPLLLERQGGTCASCPASGVPYDIDHKIYNAMLTLDHLQALCWPCHKAKTDFRPMRNRC